MSNKVEYKKILIVEDNISLLAQVSEYFSQSNKVVTCSTLADAIKAIEKTNFDIILLDVILSDGNGLKLLDYITETPVVILSDLGSDSSILDGLSAGAIDYIVKPCSNEVIEARISLRLLPDHSAQLFMHGLLINSAKRTATYNKHALNLTSSEFNILHFLMTNAGKFFTATEIYEEVWNMPYLNTATIKVHISNLRKKMLAVSPKCANLIIQEFGKGYAFIGE